MTDSSLTWEHLRGKRVVVPHHVVHRSFAAETVLLNINSGHYHGMDRVGGHFFDVLREAPSVEAAATILATEYDQPLDRIHEDTAQFCAQLVALGLIELTG